MSCISLSTLSCQCPVLFWHFAGRTVISLNAFHDCHLYNILKSWLCSTLTCTNSLRYCKVLNNLAPFDPSNVFVIYSSEYSGSALPCVRKPIRATNRLLSSLFHRSPDAWNALPAALRSSSSLTAFRGGLNNRVDFNFCECYIFLVRVWILVFFLF